MRSVRPAIQGAPPSPSPILLFSAQLPARATTVAATQTTDYQDNQARAQQAWNQRNPNYSRQYRDSHPEYVERNRNRQRVALAKNPAVAKMDVSAPPQAFPPGIYRIRPVLVSGVAKMDAWTVEITRLSDTCPCAEPVCKGMTR